VPHDEHCRQASHMKRSCIVRTPTKSAVRRSARIHAVKLTTDDADTDRMNDVSLKKDVEVVNVAAEHKVSMSLWQRSSYYCSRSEHSNLRSSYMLYSSSCEAAHLFPFWLLMSAQPPEK
jgi:hypothetical protein